MSGGAEFIERANSLADRELVERAARALGWRLVGYADGTAVVVAAGRTFGWRPLLDDGEALRLAVEVDIELHLADDEGRATWAGYWGQSARKEAMRLYCIEYHDDLNNRGDAMRATRRAIVRAAAASGVRQ